DCSWFLTTPVLHSNEKRWRGEPALNWKERVAPSPPHRPPRLWRPGNEPPGEPHREAGCLRHEVGGSTEARSSQPQRGHVRGEPVGCAGLPARRERLGSPPIVPGWPGWRPAGPRNLAERDG